MQEMMRADYGFRTSGALELSREAQRKSVFFSYRKQILK